jgi:hypothetical protein
MLSHFKTQFRWIFEACKHNSEYQDILHLSTNVFEIKKKIISNNDAASY